MSKVTTGQDPDEGTPAWYDRMFKACEVTPGKEEMLLWACENILKKLPRYHDVANRLGFEGADGDVIALVIGIIHYKEASGDFTRVLHNGEKIIGSNLKTKLVPKGRGPFKTWEESAVDALTLRAEPIGVLTTNIGEILGFIERYNGTGYIKGAGREDTSPYLWSCSNINDGHGKYTADGSYDPTADTAKSVGAAVILKDLYSKNIFKCKTSWDKRPDEKPISQTMKGKEFREPGNQLQRFALLFLRQYKWARRMLGGKWEQYSNNGVVTWHWVIEFNNFRGVNLVQVSKEDWNNPGGKVL